MRFVTKIFFGVILLFIVSCENNVDPYVPNDIQTFVNKLNLESPQAVKIILEVNDEDVYIFKVPYGPPQDCPSGCFYANFYGLKNKEKINGIELYDIDNNDTYLFTENFLELVKVKDEWIYYAKYIPLLASDKDTPQPILLNIANMLNNYISTYIAYKLIENPIVRTDKEILTILSELPVFQGDAYKDIRKIASDLLNN